MAIVHSYVNGSASGEHSPWRAQPLLAANGGARILRCLRKPSITTLTWRSEARGEGAVLRGLYWWFNNRNGKPEENGGWKNHGKNGNPWKNYGKPWEGT